jgi:hypothetical protein
MNIARLTHLNEVGQVRFLPSNWYSEAPARLNKYMDSNRSALDELKCPNCGELIPVSETISHQIAERTRAEFKAEALGQQKALATKEQELKVKEANLENIIADKVKAVQASVAKAAEKKARDEVSLELEDFKKQAEEQRAKLWAAQNTELELRKQKRELEEKSQALELEVARQVDSERTKIREDTIKQLEEEHRLKDAEKDKKLQDAVKANDELRRKLQQGSQQAQGEVLELALEELITTNFPNDNIEPVPKGVNGADVIQRVMSKSGQSCGTIVWESKRTKSWIEGWLQKLKDDQRLVKADLAVLVSEVLPKDCKHFGQYGGVWVTSPQCAIALAVALRSQLVDVAMTKLAAVGKNEKMEILYHYLSGPEFKQRVEAIVEAFKAMQEDLQEERRATERRWSRREKLIQKVVSNTSGMYGDFQGLIGSSLQTIPALMDGTEKLPKEQLRAIEFPSTTE